MHTCAVSILLNGTKALGSGYAADDEAYGDVSLVSSDSYGPSLKCTKVLASDRKHSKPAEKFRGNVIEAFAFPWTMIMVQNKSVNKY